VPGGDEPGGFLDEAVKVRAGQGDAFVEDGVDLETVLEELGEEFLAGDGIVGDVLVGLIVAAEWDCVFDFVFCHHNFFWVKVDAAGLKKSTGNDATQTESCASACHQWVSCMFSGWPSCSHIKKAQAAISSSVGVWGVWGFSCSIIYNRVPCDGVVWIQ
jgi:hypothetical protein